MYAAMQVMPGTEDARKAANAFMADCDCNLRILGLARQQIMGLV
jgi:hypothetical protein